LLKKKKLFLKGGTQLVDKSLILRKLTELEDYYQQLQEFSSLSLQQYEKSWKAQRIVERTLQIMLELSVDIASHIISDKNLRTPKSYADTFTVLEEAKILSKQLAQTMQKMAKFRNIIVHGYDKIDAAIVIDILKNRLNNFLTFKNEIISFLQEN